MYAGLQELLENLGLSECLSSDAQAYKEVGAEGNVLRFTHSSGARRAMVLKQTSLATNEFALLLPHNPLLYGKICLLLKNRRIRFSRNMADESKYGLDYKIAGLLRPF